MNVEDLKFINEIVAVAQFSLDGKIESCNNKFAQIFGYSEEEVKNIYHANFVDDVFKKSFKYKVFWENLLGGKVFTDIVKRKKNNGEDVWLHAIYYPLKSSVGDVSSVIKVALVIDNNKQNYFESHLNAKKLDAFSRKLPTIEIGTDGCIKSVNEKFLDLFGYEPSEILHQHHKMLVTDEEAESDEYQMFFENLKGGEFFEKEVLRIGKNNKKIYLQALYYPLLDEQSVCKSVLKVGIDITQEKISKDKIKILIRSIQRDLADIKDLV